MHRILLALLLVLPSVGLAHAPTGSLPPTGSPPTFPISFGTSSALATGLCLNANTSGTSAGTTCAGTNTVTRLVNTTGRPVITKLTCTLQSASGGHDAEELVTFTPIWAQGDGAGNVATTDADVTVVFADGDEQAGDTITNNTASSASPYTGPQWLRIRMDITGTITLGSVLCTATIRDGN